MGYVWMIGAPSRGRLHAFTDRDKPGYRALCSPKIYLDGAPLCRSKFEPCCAACKRIVNRSKTDAEKDAEAKELRNKLWHVDRHGGHRRDRWRILASGSSEEMIARFNIMRRHIEEGYLTRGGVRLLRPGGAVEGEYIRSKWLKEAEDAYRKTGNLREQGADDRETLERPEGGLRADSPGGSDRPVDA